MARVSGLGIETSKLFVSASLFDIASVAPCHEQDNGRERYLSEVAVVLTLLGMSDGYCQWPCMRVSARPLRNLFVITV